MSEPFLGEIKLTALNFAPRGWALCSGQILSIQQNQALFALLGTTYGGDGQRNFALPDFRGRVPMHRGDDGASSLGARAGAETVTLTQSQLPAHTHAWATSAAAHSTEKMSGAALASSAGSAIYGAPNSLVALAPSTIGAAGGNQPHNNMQPYLALTFIIALVGIFPPRN